MTASQIKYRCSSRRAGMALMLVIPAVALAAVLSYAVLANVATEDQISVNAESLAQADCLAETGVNYAMYELQQPIYSGVVWQGPSGATSLGNGTAGTFNVSATTPVYSTDGTSMSTTITSVGTISGAGGRTISRQIVVSVQVPLLATYPNQAAGINGSLTLASGMNAAGDLRSNSTVTLNSGSSVSGTVYAQSLSSTGGTDGAFVQQSNSTMVAPTSIKSYLTYKIGSQTYSATRLTSNPAAGTVLGPTVSNPAGVYYSTSNLTLSGITINGTLSVGGGLTIQGTVANTINASSNFPGLVVSNKLTVNGANVTLNVNGLTWVSQGITRSGAANTGSNLNFNGGLLIPTPSGTGLGTYNGNISLKYNSQYATVPGFSSQIQVPKNIQVVSWSQ